MKYTHKSTDGILARCICDDALHNGVRKKVWLVKVPDSTNEFLDYTDMFNVSCCFNRTYVERSKWDDVKVDTPIWVYQKGYEVSHRHFAEVSSNGAVYYYIDGRTSHTSIGIMLASVSSFVSLTPVAAKDLPWNK